MNWYKFTSKISPVSSPQQTNYPPYKLKLKRKTKQIPKTTKPTTTPNQKSNQLDIYATKYNINQLEK